MRYMLSVAGNYNFLEFISNAKSGEFFFFSHDERFMIKTMKVTDCAAFFIELRRVWLTLAMTVKKCVVAGEFRSFRDRQVLIWSSYLI